MRRVLTYVFFIFMSMSSIPSIDIRLPSSEDMNAGIKKPKKKAFVLTGGGARGAFQVGALNALYDAGIQPDIIYGTSIGALNGYLYAIGYPPSDIRDYWLSLKSIDDVMTKNRYFPLLQSGVYNLKKTETVLANIASTLKNYQICDLKVNAVNLEDGENYWFALGKYNKQEMIKWVIASASLPGVFTPKGTFIDGGVRNFAAIKEALKEGYDPICIGASYRGAMSDYKKSKLVPIIPTVLRTIDILVDEVHDNDLDLRTKCSILIEPDQNFGDTLDFNEKHIKEAYGHGYEKTRSKLSEIRTLFSE